MSAQVILYSLWASNSPLVLSPSHRFLSLCPVVLFSSPSRLYLPLTDHILCPLSPFFSFACLSFPLIPCSPSLPLSFSHSPFHSLFSPFRPTPFFLLGVPYSYNFMPDVCAIFVYLAWHSLATQSVPPYREYITGCKLDKLAECYKWEINYIPSMKTHCRLLHNYSYIFLHVTWRKLTIRLEMTKRPAGWWGRLPYGGNGPSMSFKPKL